MKHFFIILILGSLFFGLVGNRIKPIDVISNSKDLKVDTLSKLYILKTKALRRIYASDVWIKK